MLKQDGSRKYIKVVTAFKVNFALGLAMVSVLRFLLVTVCHLQISLFGDHSLVRIFMLLCSAAFNIDIHFWIIRLIVKVCKCVQFVSNLINFYRCIMVYEIYKPSAFKVILNIISVFQKLV